MDFEPVIGAVRPDYWLLIFYEKTTSPRFDRWIPGKFKHVSAVAYLQGFKAWVYVDANFGGLTFLIFSHERMKAEFGVLTKDATIIKIARGTGKMPWRSRCGFYCVSVVKHLAGMAGVEITPTGLYRYAIRNGGEPFAVVPPTNPA